ncbi:MAG: hypothetical protein GY739_00820 [Mesoflavibacter sp.]|nr:hypothetical protein [Mesoflavibacter sp.]
MKKLTKKEIIELQESLKRLALNTDIPVFVWNGIMYSTVLAYRNTDK